MIKRMMIIMVLIVSVGLSVSAQFDFTEQLPADRLTDLAKQAIEASPEWLQNDLTDNLERMQESFQDIYAEMIINPSDSKFRDEIAFCVANLGVANLESSDFYPELLEENAFYIYEHDQYLDYVRILDIGNPDTDPDYSTTVIYNIEEDGSTVEYQLPSEIYYWNIVHPRIEDEEAYYIDPDAEGDLPAAPPTGKFWRDWLFTITEEKPESRENYPVLRDAMAGIEHMWGNTETGAIGALSQWARDTLSFENGAERPHQPVRIYKLHMGRCGEWQDYTTAASRACLIPCLNTEAIGEDHVWNEFWHQRWIHWEPVNGDGYIDNPLVYENGWGKVISGVYDVAGDGYIWDVIDKYSEGYCSINVSVLDANGDPVDGARLAVKNAGYAGCYGYAGSNGQVSVMYGDGISAKGKILSEIGKFPAGSATYEIVSETQDQGVYSWTAQYTTETIPSIPWTERPSPVGCPPEYRLTVQYDVTHEVRVGNYPFGNKQNKYTRRFDGGSVDLFVVNSENLSKYNGAEPFTTHELHAMSQTGEFNFVLPHYDTWSVVASAERKLTSEQNLEITVALEQLVNDEWTEVSSLLRTVSLMPGEKYIASIAAGGEFGVQILMPDTDYQSGELFWCNAIVVNPDLEHSGSEIPLFVILDVYGELFFAPEFNEFSYYQVDDLQDMETQLYNVMPEFTWPVVGGSATGIYWYGGLTNPEMSELLGNLATVAFGWSE